MTPITSVLFDLDGTLIDTAPDIAAALNKLLHAQDRDMLPYASIRNTVSKGSRALTELGFADLPESHRKLLQQELLQIYSAAICVDSKPFPGIIDVLNELEQKKIPWGVVTNKPGWLTEPLLKQLQLWQRAACVVSGDTLPNRKPHPEPLLHACKLIGRAATESVYIGDDLRDIQAGHAAGMTTLVAGYGYIENHENPEQWGAEAIINHASELQPWLQPRIALSA